MGTSCFNFKEFTVYHDRCAMKVGTDGVLLGAWAPTNKAKRILDVGTGSGLVALMLAQRTAAHIDAVEIEASAAVQASENFARSAWSNRLRAHAVAFQDWVDAHDGRMYDLIVSNPPYFVNALKAADLGRSLARHADALTAKALFAGAAKLLLADGSLCLIVPADQGEALIVVAAGSGLVCTDRLWVKTAEAKLPKRVLLAFGHRNARKTCTDGCLVLAGSDGLRSPEYCALTKDYYLNL